MSTDRTWLKQDEAGERIGVEEQTLAVWRVRRQGPPYAKFGRSVRYVSDLLDEWAERQLVQPESDHS